MRSNIQAADALTSSVWNYRRLGHDERLMTFGVDGFIHLGSLDAERKWRIEERDGRTVLSICSDNEVTCELEYDENERSWRGAWVVHEKMPVELTIVSENIVPGHPDFIPMFAPECRHRTAVVAALQTLNARKGYPHTILELSSRNVRTDDRARDIAQITRMFAWFASIFEATAEVVDLHEHTHDQRLAHLRLWGEQVSCSSFDGEYSELLQTKSVDLLVVDLGECLGHDNKKAFDALQALREPPNLVLVTNFDDHAGRLSRGVFVSELRRAGYALISNADGHLTYRYVGSTSTERESSVLDPGKRTIAPRAIRPTPEHLYSLPLEAEVYAPKQGDFSSLTNRKVLIYWPHGLGDWVFLSRIIPQLDPTNEYFVVRYGDDSSALFEGSAFATPLYIGVNSPHVGNGRHFHNENFGIGYGEIDGSPRTFELPLGLYEQCRKHKIDTVLFHSFSECYGWRNFPFHTKGRNALPELVDSSRLSAVDLTVPLPTALNLTVEGWLQRWVEARLNSFTGRGGQRLCLICRNGYTSIDKNWGHKWREEMPHGKEHEGEEARDFMRLLLHKDPNWVFLNFEDRLFNGHDTIRDPALNSFSFAEVFNLAGAGCAPYSLMLKALMNVADLSIGVPVGPYHLSVLYDNFPSIGVWLDHLPCWYDEPKEASVNIINSWAEDQRLYDRPGSFDRRRGLDFHARHVDTHNITGQQVFESVEGLLY